MNFDFIVLLTVFFHISILFSLQRKSRDIYHQKRMSLRLPKPDSVISVDCVDQKVHESLVVSAKSTSYSRQTWFNPGNEITLNLLSFASSIIWLHAVWVPLIIIFSPSHVAYFHWVRAIGGLKLRELELYLFY